MKIQSNNNNDVLYSAGIRLNGFNGFFKHDIVTRVSVITVLEGFINTLLRMQALVLLSKKGIFVSQISQILTYISRINEPIPGMFGLF